MKNINFELYFRRINKIVDSTMTIERKITKVDTVLDFLRDNTEKNNPYTHYLDAYSANILGMIDKNTCKKYRVAYRLSNKDVFIGYYYSFFLFEYRKYKLSFKILSEIDIREFEKMDIYWRIYRLKELDVCCHLKLKMDKAEDLLENFLDDFLNQITLTDDWDFPLYLIKTLSLVNYNLNKDIYKKIVVVMKQLGLDNPYKKEYIRFLTLSTPTNAGLE